MISERCLYVIVLVQFLLSVQLHTLGDQLKYCLHPNLQFWRLCSNGITSNSFMDRPPNNIKVPMEGGRNKGHIFLSGLSTSGLAISYGAIHCMKVHEMTHINQRFGRKDDIRRRYFRFDGLQKNIYLSPHQCVCVAHIW